MRRELDPKAVREALAAYKARGVSFTEAWNACTGPGKRTELGLFIRRQYEAAYDGGPAPDGVNGGGAALLAEGTQTDGKPWTEPVASPAITRGASRPCRLSSERCRSGDGCKEPAARGYFGPLWCDEHGAQLDGVRDALAA